MGDFYLQSPQMAHAKNEGPSAWIFHSASYVFIAPSTATSPITVLTDSFLRPLGYGMSDSVLVRWLLGILIVGSPTSIALQKLFENLRIPAKQTPRGIAGGRALVRMHGHVPSSKAQSQAAGGIEGAGHAIGVPARSRPSANGRERRLPRLAHPACPTWPSCGRRAWRLHSRMATPATTSGRLSSWPMVMGPNR